MAKQRINWPFLESTGKIGFGYDSGELSTILDHRGLHRNHGTLIGLNFSINNRGLKNIIHYFDIKLVYFFTNRKYKDFRLKFLKLNPSIEVKRLYGIDMPVRHPHFLKPLNNRRQNLPDVNNKELEYFKDGTYHFGFGFISKDELKILTVMGNEVILSGSKMTFGIFTENLKKVFTSKFQSKCNNIYFKSRK